MTVNSSEPGRAVVERYYAALGSGDFDTVIALHAPEVVCWMSGRSIVSGRFQGREALFGHMRHHVLGPLIVDSEDYVKETRVVVSEGPFVAAILHGGLPNKVGGRYDQYYLQVFRLGDGIIQEIVEIFDTAMFEQAVMGHRLADVRSVPAKPFTVAPPLAAASSPENVRALADRFEVALQSGDFAGAGPFTLDAELAVIGSTLLSGVAPLDLARLSAVFAHGVAWSNCICADARGAVLLMQSEDPAYAQQYGVVLEVADMSIGRISIFEDTVEAERVLHRNALIPGPSKSIMPAFDVRLAFAR